MLASSTKIAAWLESWATYPDTLPRKSAVSGSVNLALAYWFDLRLGVCHAQTIVVEHRIAQVDSKVHEAISLGVDG